MDRCKVKGCGTPTDNGVTYGDNKIPVCWNCWAKYSDGKIDLKAPDAFVGESAIFTRKRPAVRQDARQIACLF